jgi:hypothetical protein
MLDLRHKHLLWCNLFIVHVVSFGYIFQRGSFFMYHFMPTWELQRRKRLCELPSWEVWSIARVVGGGLSIMSRGDVFSQWCALLFRLCGGDIPVSRRIVDLHDLSGGDILDFGVC